MSQGWVAWLSLTDAGYRFLQRLLTKSCLHLLLTYLMGAWLCNIAAKIMSEIQNEPQPLSTPGPESIRLKLVILHVI